MNISLYAWAAASSAAAEQPDFDCVLEPSEIAAMASQKHGEAVKVGQAAVQGEFEKLTVKQLQKLAQSNSISIARTKKEFIGLLKPLEPGVDIDSLKGPQLSDLIKKHKIGALRSKDELVSLLKTLFENKAKQESVVQFSIEQAAALKSKIADGLASLQGLKPQDFSKALTSFKELNAALSEVKALLPEPEWSALKSQVDYARGSFDYSVKSLGGKELKDLAQKGGIKHYQWAGKDDLIVLMSSDDPAAIQAAKDNIEVKWAKWAEKHGGKSAPTPEKPTLPKPVEAPPPEPPMNPEVRIKSGKWEKIPEGREHLIDEAREAGWQGKSLPIDSGDIEDQNVLLYSEEVKGKIRTVIRMKIRPESERKLLAMLTTGPNDTIGQAAGRILADDVFYDNILTAVKSVNHHLDIGTKNFSRPVIDKALKHRKSLLKLAKEGDADLKAMATQYLKTLDELDRLIATSTRTKISTFERFLKVEAPVKPSGDRILAVKRTTVYGDKKEVAKGKIIVKSEDVAFGKVHSNFTSSGLEYKIDLGDGVEGVYKPWREENYYAQQGQLEIRVMKDCTAETADKLLSKLERLGVDATFASPEQTEIMFLSKQAYILKEDSSPAWKKLMQRLDHDKAAPSERVRAMRSYWSDRFGVADVTKMPGYDPEGKYSIMASGWKQKQEAGWRHQLRFDISDEQINRELKGYGLYHQITGGGGLPEVLESALENNGAMVSTVEKIRIGIPVGGMSPSSDMGSGGASYFFTRIRKLPTAGGDSNTGFYFKPTLLRRMDAITYDSDKYGRVTDDHVRKHRHSTIEEFKRIGGGHHSDETIFKNNVTILDNINLVAVSSESERKRVLDVFKRHGVNHLPDGRRVEDIVVRGR